MKSKKNILDYTNNYVCKVFQRDYNTSKDTSELVFNELLKYLYLTSRDKENVLAMYPYFSIIDDMWHTFILCTKDYLDFCEKYFGYYIHHHPIIYEENNFSTTNETEEETITYRKMLNLIYDNFGSETIDLWFNKFPLTVNKTTFKIDLTKKIPNLDFLDFLEEYRNGLILNIGKEILNNTLYLCKIAKEVICISENKVIIDKINNENYPNVITVNQRINDFEFKKEKFKLINISFEFENNYKINNFLLLDNIFNSLKPNGYIFMKIYVNNIKKEDYLEFINQFETIKDSKITKVLNDINGYYYFVGKKKNT